MMMRVTVRGVTKHMTSNEHSKGEKLFEVAEGY